MSWHQTHTVRASTVPACAASHGRSPRRRSLYLAAGAAIGIAGLAVSSAGHAQVDPAATTSTLDGSTSENAAASCWEIKQTHPSSTDGVYWLRTESLERPDEFYCDMTTDGGGWVLIGRGREGWTFRDYGQSTPQNIRTNPDGTAAFAPGALSTETIDGLMNDGHVVDLVDGVRVRRATNVAGTDWQELRWNFDDLTTWSWAFGGGHRLASFTIDGSGDTGSNTKDSNSKLPGETGNGNRGENGDERWFTYPWSGHGGLAGFSYGGNIGGQNNATSYLWEYNNENHAIAFTQVYIRPQLTTPVLPSIPDTGTAEQTLSPLASDRPEELAGGVVGVRKVGDSEPQVDAPVLAFATSGDRVYVGGKFDDVRDSVTGDLVDQNYLAAFDRDTGAWISTFTPQLDGTVWDLAIADGKLIVAGQFTNVDGEALTAGLAALDPITGAVLPGWRASMELSGSSARPYARAIDIENVGGTDWVYVGGNFTKIESLTTTRNEARLGRVRLSDGYPDNAFLPNVDGVPYDIDAADGRVYVVGSFNGVNGNDDRGVSTVDWNTGTVIAGLAPAVYTTSNSSRQYQQAVIAVGDEVWQGGSEHNTHVYADADYSLVKSHVTSGRGGDTQAFAQIDGTVYQSSHGNSWIYEDAMTWPGLDDYSRVDDYKWVGAFDVADRTYSPTWVPSLNSAYTEGVWALHADVDGCLWFGGDILGGPYVGGQRQYLESFSKFCQRDIQAPTVPTNASVTTLNGGAGNQLTWSDSTDDFPGFIGYEVLRNDRVVSPLVYGTSYVDPFGNAADRYFVRAVDPGGNRSASTPVLLSGDNTAPSTPSNLTAVLNADDSIDLSWTASTDNIAVTDYVIYRNGVEILVVPGIDTTVNLPGLGVGSHWLQVRALDAAGNESFKTPPVRVDIDDDTDTQRPTQPGSPAATVDEATGIITMTWTASADNVEVTGYTVRRNLAEVDTVDGDTLSVELDLGLGGHYLQVEAFDAAGNISYRTAPVYVEVDDGTDTENPTVPTDLTGAEGADASIDITWTASTDNVGVTSYQILRNGVEVLVVDGATTSANLTGLGSGLHYIQVRAFDAAGNQSYKTPPIEVTVAAADTTPPSTPSNLQVAVEADDSLTVTWDASTDNVGVAEYRVLRNLAEVALVDGATPTASLDLGAGDHWIQVQALDAAGNESFRTAPVMVSV
ncbi:fibrinogen-like YCDxxxxGGGW domain-containing protein [Ilumatobacter coccineus]|uniref:Fibronectin type-III domain-containing protein n=1 Tax=Ilumatobacter coccineus (strain NBRC 103263 / KCTC 29153 / YM16-304) TaxID=1313172 RepID=A0A6C7E3J4_ILUCY|nr:fibrinogen-like YCDxxxxGGGW domain-containing protein [Ilumatobacter coccineus]BAN02524.1 hypothetical protein YM304_22100 [Ilumatobacter coccineus YM16-304]